MASFIHPGFLFTSRHGEKLYHDYSENLPLIDFHCHLSPEMISTDRQFENITHAWLEGDHYKWRAMRVNGISERFCTGDAAPEEKFMKWASTVPFTLGNPLYHWTHLELARYFNIYRLLSPETAAGIYEETSSLLRTEGFSTKALIKKMNVELICTTDDPVDNLEFHCQLGSSFNIPILPTFRPDNVLKTDNPFAFAGWVNKLSEASGLHIRNIDTLLEALDKRHEYFHGHGCRLSDHGLDDLFFQPESANEAGKLFLKLLKGKPLSVDETSCYRTVVLAELCRMNHRRGWIQQFHLGALRNNNTRMLRLMGPDMGWDSMGPALNPVRISRFLNLLDEEEKLAKTIMYNNNPADNGTLITMAGNFSDGTVPAKVQYGAAWWFLDQMNGIEKHLRDLSSFGMLSRFIGMVTDSRSVLSYPRHEYFRRIACNFVGESVEKGLMPDDEGLLRTLIEGISYRNAKEYFELI